MKNKHVLKGLRQLWIQDGLMEDEASIESVLDSLDSIKLDGAKKLYVDLLENRSSRRPGVRGYYLNMLQNPKKKTHKWIE